MAIVHAEGPEPSLGRAYCEGVHMGIGELGLSLAVAVLLTWAVMEWSR